jgi:aspartate aminotransferase
VAMQNLAGGCEPDPAAVAHQEFGAELAFERPDLLGERGLCDVQSRGGSHELTFPCDGEEVGEVAEFHVSAKPMHSIVNVSLTDARATDQPERVPTVASVVAPSATLAANERVQAKLDAGAPVLHLAFGEAGLPVLASGADQLAAAARHNGYGSVAGSPLMRAAAAGYFERRGVPTTPDQVLVAPGSKPLLFGLLSILPGDVVLPRPSWVSYAAQAALARKRVIGVAIPENAGGVPDPAALRDALVHARSAGHRPGILVLTLPDNPTGTLAPRSLLVEICEIAQAHGLLIVADEIYRDLAHEPDAVCSPATLAPDRVFVTNGLSKSMALGGWRIGFARLPDGPLGADARRALAGLASEVWSSLAAPMQHAAAYVLDEPDDVREHVARSRRLHRLVTTAAHREVVAAGAECRAPAGGFYLYPDLEPVRSALGVATGAELADLLLERHDVAVLHGEAFGDEPAALRFRIATSLLHGRTDDERWEALAAEDPVSLPWIRSALDRLGKALRALGDGD